MRRPRCGLVLALLASSGCYEMHGRSADAGGIPTVDAPIVLIDVAARRDSEVLLADVPEACPLARPDASCMESFGIVANVAFTLPFSFDGCACCVETSCSVSVDEARHVIRLTTGLCPDPCDCDACNTPTGVCNVPPIPAREVGEWTVETNGVASFRIGVFDPIDPVFVPPPPGCATYAELDECGGGEPDLDGWIVPPEQVCVEHAARSDRTVLRVTDTCASCGHIDSSCTALVARRLTDDLPDGYDIELSPRTYATECDIDCPGVCIVATRECFLPPLEPDAYYRVRYDGEDSTRFFGRDLASCHTTGP